MRSETQVALTDIEVACTEITEIVGTDHDVILHDRLRALAIERLFLIIGEALNRIRKQEPELLQRITDFNAIIGMRNAIVHGYDQIEPRRIRDAVRDNVPILLAEVRALRS